MKVVFKTLAVAVVLVFALAACNRKPAFVNPGENGSRTKDEVGFQFELPQEGEEIAVLHTALGDIKIRLFPKSAPLGVANFKQLIESGYYTEKTFHRATYFCIQGGSENGDGTGGTSAWGKPFEFEFNQNLRHFRGALSYANTGKPNTNDCQFFVVTPSAVSEENMESYKSKMTIEKTLALYEEHGGEPWLDDAYTVFGQVFEGMEVVDAIGAMETESDILKEPIAITGAELVKYQK